VRANKRFLVLILSLAVITAVMEDVGRLQDMSWHLHGLASTWQRASSRVYASPVTQEEITCTEPLRQESGSDRFHWAGEVTAGQSIEIKDLNGDISAEPAVGGEIDVVAVKQAHRSDPASVQIKVVPHPRGVTICAVYPGEVANTCEPGPGNRLGNSLGNGSVHNNDVKVNFTVRVPAGVEFVGRTVNGEINADSLRGNVDSHTVNGGIKVSTSGYARAKSVNGDIEARMGSADWAEALELKTVNGAITVALPAALSARLEAETLNGAIESDFAVTQDGSFAVTQDGKLNRKRVRGIIGAGGRDLILKTLNGSIRVRKAG